MNLICFSHLRWNFIYQRPQHILSRLSKKYKVFYIEEAVYDANIDGYSSTFTDDNVTVIVPHLNNKGDKKNENFRLKQVLNSFLLANNIEQYIFWYYTPMALPFSSHLNPKYIVYDCMDELSAFKFAPQHLKDLEAALIDKADVIFTGGNALYEAKKHLHSNIHAFPSSIDKKHFGSARHKKVEVKDQKQIKNPKLGFFGVIDERFDIDVIAKAATAKPDWQFILIGPIVKIDPATLPKNANIHYLGSKTYNELPDYISTWDIALIPFAINESTKFISPTKTPEYLAAGKPVVSSAITDVIFPYAIESLVHIYTSVDEFISLVNRELETIDKSEWLARVDEYLAAISWDFTCRNMQTILEKGMISKKLNLKLNKQNVRLSYSGSGSSRLSFSREAGNPS